MAVQDNVTNAFSTLSTMQILDGSLITNIKLSSGDNKVAHGLNRIPLGWIVVDRSANANLYRSSWDDRNITINSSATSTIALWVF